MASQDDIVTNFQTHINATADTLILDILTYHQTLANLLFDIATLDQAHTDQILTSQPGSLLKLLKRLELLTQTVKIGLTAGSI